MPPAMASPILLIESVALRMRILAETNRSPFSKSGEGIGELDDRSNLFASDTYGRKKDQQATAEHVGQS